MYKIFYDEETLQIKGISDGEVSMEFPYLETDVATTIPFETFKIVLEGETPTLKVKENFSDEEWEKLISE